MVLRALAERRRAAGLCLGVVQGRQGRRAGTGTPQPREVWWEGSFGGGAGVAAGLSG